MKLVVLVLSLLICVPALALAQTGGGSGGGTGGSGGSVNGRGGSSTFRANNPMPVLIYTVWSLNAGTGSGGSGSGVTSSSDVSTLVVYDNGLATWSQSNADGSNSSGCSGNCLDTVQLSSTQVNTFLQQLRQAGAFRQESNNGSASSSATSLSTVTVFSNISGSTSTARTFSFYTAQGRTAQVRNAFSTFFTNNFGSSSVNGNNNHSNNNIRPSNGSASQQLPATPSKKCTPVRRNPITGDVYDDCYSVPKSANGHFVSNGNGSVGSSGASTPLPSTPVRVRQPPGGKCAGLF